LNGRRVAARLLFHRRAEDFETIPGARLLQLSKYGLEPITLEQTDHFRLIQDFISDPTVFVKTTLDADS